MSMSTAPPDRKSPPASSGGQSQDDENLLRSIAARTPGVDYHSPSGQLGSYGRGPRGEPTFQPFHPDYVDWLVNDAKETDAGGQRADERLQVAQFPASDDDVRKYYPNTHLKDPVVTPPPPNPVTGEWGPAFAASSPGQTTTDSEGEHAIQSAYASKKGGTYTVDPLVMHMEHAIDIGGQIQSSIDNRKGMHSVLTNALASPDGRANFNWPKKAFNDGLRTPDGRSVGRFSGDVTGTMIVDRKNRTWRVEGSIGIRPDEYNWNLDSPTLAGDVAIAAGAITPDLRDKTLNLQGKTVRLEYNRKYKFQTRGRF